MFVEDTWQLPKEFKISQIVSHAKDAYEANHIITSLPDLMLIKFLLEKFAPSRAPTAPSFPWSTRNRDKVSYCHSDHLC